MTTAELTTYAIDVTDIEYLRHGDKPLLARLYKPRGTGPFPIVVDLHGGAWCKKDRMADAGTDEPLAKSGVIVVALDFRMPPDAGYPASLADVNYAIRWCKAHAAEWNGRADRVGVARRLERRSSGDARGDAPRGCALRRAAAGRKTRG